MPGGSVFNGVISLGRSGVPASFISETGNDRVGERIITFSRENGVNADNIAVYPESKSPVSLAFLNDKNDADYIFYKDHPHDQMDFVYPDIQPDDIVMFGLTPNLLENLEYADIVRGSAEDFDVLYKKTDADAIYRSQIAFYTKNFIFTQGSDPVELRAVGDIKKQYEVEKMETLSTIGAGDNFNAGFVYGLIKYGITREMILNGFKEALWDKLIACAQKFSANVCKSIDNSVDKAFGQQMAQEMQAYLQESL